jgi:hypothetical protein
VITGGAAITGIEEGSESATWGRLRTNLLPLFGPLDIKFFFSKA